jgi:murein L,D-transpeptidase YafK
MKFVIAITLILLAGCLRGEGSESPSERLADPKASNVVATTSSVDAPAKIETQSEMILLTVDKEDLRAELRTWPSQHQASRALSGFTIAVGKERGDKEREGDNRTPEGIYFTEGLIDGEKLPEKYGPKAIPINFPNPMDRLSKKSGYGIWLHGVENNARIEEANVTEGCVAFYNEDIDELAHWLKPHQGIVVIARDSAEVNRPADVQDLMSQTQNWAASWRERRLDDYVAHYHSEFKYKGLDRSGFHTYKKNVFAGYKQMTVEFGDIRAVTHPKYAISFMNQDFNGDDRFITKGRKILYWSKDESGQWRIIHEIHEDRRVENLAITPDALASLTKTANASKTAQKNQTTSSNL